LRIVSRKTGEFGSRLVVVWYQSNFAMPIDDQVLREIKPLNWSEVAGPIEDF
jgi:hypothetical protein